VTRKNAPKFNLFGGRRAHSEGADQPIVLEEFKRRALRRRNRRTKASDS
jgi:hypothetical protein